MAKRKSARKPRRTSAKKTRRTSSRAKANRRRTSTRKSSAPDRRRRQSRVSSGTALAGLGLAGAGIGAATVAHSLYQARKEEKAQEEAKKLVERSQQLMAEYAKLRETFQNTISKLELSSGNHEIRDKFKQPTVWANKLKGLKMIVENEIKQHKDKVAGSRKFMEAFDKLKTDMKRTVEAMETRAPNKRPTMSKLDTLSMPALIDYAENLTKTLEQMNDESSDDGKFKEKLMNFATIQRELNKTKNKDISLGNEFKNEWLNSANVSDFQVWLSEMKETLKFEIAEVKEAMVIAKNSISARTTRVVHREKLDDLLTKPTNMDILDVRENAEDVRGDVERVIEYLKIKMLDLKKLITKIERDISEYQKLRTPGWGQTILGWIGFGQ